MRNTPELTLGRDCVERIEIVWLGHSGIREGPEKRSNREISGGEHDTIGQCDPNQAVQSGKIRDINHPTRDGPSQL